MTFAITTPSQNYPLVSARIYLYMNVSNHFLPRAFLKRTDMCSRTVYQMLKRRPEALAFLKRTFQQTRVWFLSAHFHHLRSDEWGCEEVERKEQGRKRQKGNKAQRRRTKGTTTGRGTKSSSSSSRRMRRNRTKSRRIRSKNRSKWVRRRTRRTWRERETQSMISKYLPTRFSSSKMKVCLLRKMDSIQIIHQSLHLHMHLKLMGWVETRVRRGRHNTRDEDPVFPFNAPQTPAFSAPFLL